MNSKVAKINQDLSINVYAIADLIATTQRESGEIPWCDSQKTDPWDHVEAAMGLTIGGYFKEAQLAFEWLSRMQLEDGSWFSSYMNGIPEDKTREANMASYVAVGVFHYYLITGDKGFLSRMWNTVRRAIDFTISLQAPGGEIYWAISPEEKIDPMALLTGSSSIYMSLKCAISVSQILGHEMTEWVDVLKKLGNAIRNKPYLFNMTKSRFSMDWFYPVLTGAITGIEAQKRISRSWKKFIVKGQGVRCVSDEPWVTIAETSELSLALSAMGNNNLSQIVFNWICGKTYEDGSYWCGFTVPDIIIWPEEKITWTNAVVLMAADAIYNLTPAGRLFCHDSWNLSRLSSSGAKAKDNNIYKLTDNAIFLI
ncbi:MAG: phenyltransferase domain-containing protein [Desulfobacterales bacterium]